MIKAIGLAGPDGVGKSTLARALQQFDMECEIVSMATPLKNMLRSLMMDCGMNAAQVDWAFSAERKNHGLVMLEGRSPRDAMRTLGTEWGRDSVGPNLWVNVWKRKVLSQLPDHVTAIADDVRFPNEVAAIRSIGGVVIRLHRDGIGHKKGHVSNLGIDNPDFDVNLSMGAEPAAFYIMDLLAARERQSC